MDVRHLPALWPQADVSEPRRHGHLLRGAAGCLGPVPEPSEDSGVWLALRCWPDGLRSPPHSHLSLTTEPGQNTGRSLGELRGPAVLGQPSEQWPSVFPPSPACQQPVHSAKQHCVLGHWRGAGQELWSGAGPRKGAVSPSDKKERAEVMGTRCRWTGQALLPVASAWPTQGAPALERCERLAFPFLSLARSGRLANSVQ